MKKLMIALILAGSAAAPVAAVANIQCGIKPIAPIGCDYNTARCVCDSNGNCQWIFDC